MNDTLANRYLSRTGRTLTAGLLGCWMWLSLSLFGSIAPLVSRGAFDYGSTSESERGEKDAKESEALARETGMRWSLRRFVGRPQTLSTLRPTLRSAAVSGFTLTPVAQRPATCGQDRRNGCGAQLRC